MVPSKSRSGKKWNQTILSKTKLCRGDSSNPQINSDAHVSVDRKPSNSENLSENQSSRRLLEMHETEMEKLEEEIMVLRERLICAETDRNRALDELRMMRKSSQEINCLKELLYTARRELNSKQCDIECLKSEKDEIVQRLRESIDNAREREARTKDLLSDQKKRILELEEEVESRKISESKILDSLERSESEKIDVEELKVSKERENEALSKVKSLTEEVAQLKNEVKLATEAEEKSKKAMDMLALALKEVAEEATDAKETVKTKLIATQLELDRVKKENEELKAELEEAKKEAETHKNASDRMRLEAEETLMAWNGKEMGFVSCIKSAEDERDKAQRESARLRDILKQAISEANAAKAASKIAIDENSKLKDSIAEMEDSLRALSQENQLLKTHISSPQQSQERLGSAQAKEAIKT